MEQQTDTAITPEETTVNKPDEVKKPLPEIDPVIQKLQNDLKEKADKLAAYEAEKAEREKEEQEKKEAKLLKDNKLQELIAEKDNKLATIPTLETELKELREFKNTVEAERQAKKDALLEQIEEETTREIYKDATIEMIETYLQKTGKTSGNSPDNRVRNNFNPETADMSKMSREEARAHLFNSAKEVKQT